MSPTKVLLIQVAVAAAIVVGGFLSGCATTTPEIAFQPKEVDIPVTVYCSVNDPDKPVMVFDTQAQASMSLLDKLKLLIEQDLNLKGYTVALQGTVDACRASQVDTSVIPVQDLPEPTIAPK